MDEPSARTLHAPLAWLPLGWAREVRVVLHGARIATVEAGAPARPGDRVLAGRALLPAMPNLHSHAFQRAMAGLAERRGTGEDSFWSWRETMYRLVEALSPEDVEAISAMTFLEMLERGFASVAEFHYLHHGPQGVPYDDPAELSRRVIEAAERAGIGLTLLPVLYAHGGVRRAPLSPAQHRFGCDPDRLLAIHGAARRALPEGAAIGVAAHSLRATTPAQIADLLAALPEGPIHVHAAEQVREVEEVGAWLGRRPVALLLDRFDVGPRWCVIHATHMTAAETEGLARSGAVAGLCPITEANLGDGIFEGRAYLAAGGAFGVGSDSNLRIGLAEELRLLEDGQRLRARARNVLAGPGESVGESLYARALSGGARALAREAGAIRPGALADLVAIERWGDVLGPLPDDRILDGWIFAAGDGVVREVWSGGRLVVEGGRHRARGPIARRYHAAMAALRGRL